MTVHIHPGKSISFQDLPSRGIALDGYVEGPHADPEGRRFSFDHHGTVPRIALGATCRQVLDAILLGFDPRGYDVFVNHIDADSVLSVWLLQHSALLQNRESRQLIRSLVDAIAEGDALGPAYPLRDEGLASTFHLSVMEPRREIADLADPEQCRNGLDRCLELLSQWHSKGFKPDPHPSLSLPDYKAIDMGSWVCALVGEAGTGALQRITTILYAQGYDAMLVCSPSNDADRRKYSLAKRSDFVVGFDIPAMCASLNAAEREKNAEQTSCWGGSSTVGGSPRPDGSVLSREEVVAIIDSIVSGGYSA